LMEAYFDKVEKKELEMLPERMEREKETWLNLVDFPTWQILRILGFGSQHVRGMAEHFSGSTNTLYDRLDKMDEWNLVKVSEKKGRKTYEITSLGERLLSAYDKVGEIAKAIRGEGESPTERTNL